MNKRILDQLKATGGAWEAIQRLADRLGVTLAKDNSDDDGRGGLKYGVDVYKPGAPKPVELMLDPGWDEDIESEVWDEDMVPRCLAFLKEQGVVAVYAPFAEEAYTPEEWAVEADAYLDDGRDARLRDQSAVRRPFRAVDRTGQTWEVEESDNQSRQPVKTVFVVTGPPDQASRGSDYAEHPTAVVSSDARWYAPKVGHTVKMTEPGHGAWERDKRMARLG